jgi:hypothetical protein
MGNQRTDEGGWFPLRGSYEEAVLSWYEQIEMSFRRRELEAQRSETGEGVRTQPQQEARPYQTVSD